MAKNEKATLKKRASLILRNWLKSTGKPNNKIVLYKRRVSLIPIPNIRAIIPM
jgi:hypothetical protein